MKENTADCTSVTKVAGGGKLRMTLLSISSRPTHHLPQICHRSTSMRAGCGTNHRRCPQKGFQATSDLHHSTPLCPSTPQGWTSPGDTAEISPHCHRPPKPRRLEQISTLKPTAAVRTGWGQRPSHGAKASPRELCAARHGSV